MRELLSQDTRIFNVKGKKRGTKFATRDRDRGREREEQKGQNELLYYSKSLS